MGRRRSVYLSDAIDAELEALGVPLPDVIKAGLNALAGQQPAKAKAKRQARAPQCQHGYPTVRQVAGRRVCRECGPV